MQRGKTISSQFGLTSGIRQGSSDFISLPRPERGGRVGARRGKLWILAEPASSSGGAGTAAKMVLETIEEEYYSSGAPTVLTALEESVQAANKGLCEYNAGAPSHKQAYLGVTCVVIQGREASFAQVQPARAIVVHQGTPRTFPEGQPRAEADLTPLGLEGEIDIELNRSDFEPGDTVSVLSAGLAESLSMTEDEYGLSYQDHEGAIEQLYHIAARNNLLDEHAFVIEEPARKSLTAGRGSFTTMGREWFNNIKGSSGSQIESMRRRFTTMDPVSEDEDGSEGPQSRRVAIGGRVKDFFVQPKSRRFSGGRGRWRQASTLVGVALLLLLAGGLGLRAVQGYQRTSRLESLLTAAESQRQQARGKPTEAAIQHLKSARDLLKDAKKIDPAHAKVRAELRLINADWDTVNKVVRLKNLKRLMELPEYVEGSAARLVVVGDKAIVLTRPAGALQVYDFKKKQVSALSPKGSVHFVAVTRLGNGISAIDNTGRVYGYNFAADSWGSTKLGGKHSWASVSAFDTNGKQAYVGLKGTPGLLVYDLDSPEQPVKINSRVDGQPLSPSGVTAAGSVWLTNSYDDSIWKVQNGKVMRRLLVDAQPRVEVISGIVAALEGKSLYMIDEQRDRVLHIGPNGQLRAQLTLPADFAGGSRIDAMYATPGGKELYLVVGKSLHRWRYTAPAGNVAGP